MKNEAINLKRSATKFTTGGFRPSHQLEENWIGDVYLYKPDETIPKTSSGGLMCPVLQLFLPSLPAVPSVLIQTKVLTLFVAMDLDQPLAERWEPMSNNNWCLREYLDVAELEIRNLKNNQSELKPFPLKPELIADFPNKFDPVVPEHLRDPLAEITETELYKTCYEHKLGGWPTYCQDPVDFGSDYEFALQVATDEKANLSIFGSGSLLFAKHKKSGDWKMYYDFF